MAYPLTWITEHFMRYTIIPSSEASRHVSCCMNGCHLTFGSKAGVSSVMCAYNRFNEVSSCHNAQLLAPKGLLGNDGFKGQGSARIT